MRRIPALWPVVLFVVSAAPVGAAPAPEAKDATTIPFLPGGVADAAGVKGFVTDATGGVTALDLGTGEILWQTKTAGRPLAVVGGRIWAQVRDKANVLRVIGLGVDDGKPAVESDPIILPDWVPAVEGTVAGRSFASSAYRDGGDLLLSWQANASYWGGAAPSPQMEKAARKHAEGVARIDLASGKVTTLEAGKAPPPPSSAVKVSKGLEKIAARLYGFGPQSATYVATAGDNAVAADVEFTAAGKQKLVLHRWDLTTEKPLDPVVLAEGAAFQAVTIPSAGVALVRDASPPNNSEWTVYALATGKATAHFAAEANAREFTAIGSRAYYAATAQPKGPGFGQVLPRTLKAVDLTTGKRLWESPLEGERLPPPPPP